MKKFKHGEVITVINDVTFYYLAIDYMTFNGKPCHFLTTDMNNNNCAFRVTEDPEKWKNVCRRHYENMMKE